MAELIGWNASVGYDWAEIAPGVQARLPRPLAGGGSDSHRMVLELRHSLGDAFPHASVHLVAPSDDGVTIQVTAHIDGADLYRAVAQQMHRHAVHNGGTRD